MSSLSALLSPTSNYSFYAIPAAWVLSIIPHWYAIGLAARSFDNRQPRVFIASLEKNQRLDNVTRARIARAEGAQTNGFENMGLFASAVVAGNLAGLPTTTLNILTGGYLLTRALYNIIYIAGTSKGVSLLRTLVFFAGLVQIMTLFLKSGNVLMNRAANSV